MYYVTNDYKNFVPYGEKQLAIQMADMFKGVVFIMYEYENIVVYSSEDY